MRSGIIRMTRTLAAALAVGLVCLALPLGAVAQTAHYTATLDVTWSAATHPTEFPSGAHLSGLVGATHGAAVSFWDPGELASLGIKRMAEWGSQAELLAEVQTALDAGQALAPVADDPLWTVPGSTGVDIVLSPEFPLATLVAMIAPSPDWFLGVRNVDLRPNGEWTQELVVDLYPFDAGTDSGPTYKSPDAPTVPPAPITLITGSPFTPGVPLGTLTFTRQYVTEVPQSPLLATSVFPNPFNPRTTVAWDLPARGPLQVVIFDAAGRAMRTLWNAETAAGPGRVSWDGRDDAGRQLGAGVYFTRVSSAAASRTIKITLLK